MASSHHQSRRGRLRRRRTCQLKTKPARSAIQARILGAPFPKTPTGSRTTDLGRSRPIDNALGSTGPKTEDGKRRSRRNTVRHGSTAETVVVALEDIEDYQPSSWITTPDSP